MQPDYLVHIDTLKKMPAKNLPDFFDGINGIRLEDIKLVNLIFFNGMPIFSGNGAYIIKTKDEYLYVGDCSSRNFSERIGGHFDLRSTAWMNTFFKNLVKRRGQEVTNDNLTQAARQVVQDAFLIMINFDFHKEDHNILVQMIDKFEKVLMAALQPYNMVKTKVDLEKTVDELIS